MDSSDELLYPSQDGLSHPWLGRVWLHPPVHGKTAKWINKLIAEYDSGRVLEAVLLVTPSAGSKWFQKLTRLFLVCFPDERILFLDAQGRPQPRPMAMPSSILVRTKRFKQVLEQLAVLVVLFKHQLNRV